MAMRYKERRYQRTEEQKALLRRLNLPIREPLQSEIKRMCPYCAIPVKQPHRCRSKKRPSMETGRFYDF